MPFDTLLTGGLVVSADGTLPMDVAITDGRFAGLLAPGSARPEAAEVVDVRGRHLFPGVIDPHAHIGFGGPDDWDVETAGGVRGGVTTVLNYVLGSDSYLDLLPIEIASADAQSRIDYGLHVCPCTEQQLEELDSYIDRFGVTSFKFFTSFRGDEGAYLGVAGTDDGLMFDYFRRVARRPGAVANVHTENIEVVWRLRDEVRSSGMDGLPAYNACRPSFVEAEAAYRAAYYARVTGSPLYVVHTSSSEALREVLRAREAGGPPVYIETCTHYLTHHEDSDVGSLGKVNPPLRRPQDCATLWDAIADGTIDTVGSDHAARARARKEVGIWESPNGIPGIGCILPLLLSEGHHKRGIALERIVELTSANAARIFGLLPRKGGIRVGADADLAVVDLDAERTVDRDTWESNSGFNLYEGWTVRGWPTDTMVRGRWAMRDGRVLDTAGTGIQLPRTAGRAEAIAA